MSNGESSQDRDLLKRLNALKKTHIDLDDKQYRTPATAKVQLPVDPSPAKSLHNDLLSRFRSLNGTKLHDVGTLDRSTPPDNESANALIEEDSKTVEELLADLGPEDGWSIEKDEATQIDDLLRSANFVLKDTKPDQSDPDSINDMHEVAAGIHEFPSVDVEVSNLKTDDDPDPRHEGDDEDDGPHKSKQELESEIDREADDIIARLKDELKNAPPSPPSDSEDENPNSTTTAKTLPTTPAFDLPTTPSKDPETSHPDTADTDTDTDLAKRFASLSLPSAPSTTLGKPTNTTRAKPAKFGSTSTHQGHTNEEIDSWCVICLEDATLSCLGCDGDLYCAKCWMEGHRGPDAGYEERKHRAVQYNQGGGGGDDGDGRVKKEMRRKVAA